MNKERFDITCTATLRPELLDKTFSSFTRNLFKERISCARLVINIDMTGTEQNEQEEKLADVIGVVGNYPFYKREIRVGRAPHFPTAFCWCMDEIENKYFFHLEEDWELLFPIDFEAMWNLFNDYWTIAHLRLSSFLSEELTCKNWNKFLHWNGKFFEALDEDKFSIGWAGHPSLNRSSFIKDCLPYIDRMANPEKQIKGKIHPEITELIRTHRFGSFHPQNSPKSIVDIGREWMVNNGWSKAGNKAWFTTWERSNQ